MKQNQINFSLLATIPAILVFTFLTIATKSVIENRLLKRRKSDLFTLRLQIIRKLRQIEQLLILNTETPKLTIDDDNHELIIIEAGNDERIMSQIIFGQFLSLIYELKYSTNQLKSERILSKEFNEDINLLTTTQLTAKQKLLIIQQIFHSYSFLVHSS